MLARKRAWRAKNPEVAKRIREKAYQKADKSYYAVATRKRKATLLSAPGSGLNHEQWLGILDNFGGKCAYCLGDATSIDHIVPISRGGAHDPENIVPACKSCNSKKGNRSLLRLVVNGGGVV
jgi:5-methylcytosine-specific restriction endonuclease McrA